MAKPAARRGRGDSHCGARESRTGPESTGEADIPDPPFACIPGQTARHPEDWFDPLKSDMETALSAGLQYFERGFHWECHEVLEAVWMKLPNPSADRDMVQAIIQLANARLKLRMGRPKAAMRLCGIVGGLLDGLPEDARPLGLDPKVWRVRLEETAV